MKEIFINEMKKLYTGKYVISSLEFKIIEIKEEYQIKFLKNYIKNLKRLIINPKIEIIITKLI